MSEPVVYQNVEQACAVLDSVCASPSLPSALYDWQKDAWCFIRAYIKESQKHQPTTQWCNRALHVTPIFQHLVVGVLVVNGLGMVGQTIESARHHQLRKRCM
jgi:hypothetical protein